MAALLLVPTNDATARLNEFNSGIELAQEYDSNFYTDEINPQDFWLTRCSPLFTLSSSGALDSLMFQYNPALSYNYFTERENIEHNLLLEVAYNMLPHWQLNVKEKLIQSDDPAKVTREEDEETLDGTTSLSRNLTRERYWHNNVTIESNLNYRPGSIWKIGYSNTAAESDDPEFSDFVRHYPFTMLSHQFNPQWRAGASYSYTKGNFDKAGEGLTSNEGSVNLDHLLSRRHTVSANYTISQAEFVEADKDYTFQIANLAWSFQISKEFNITTSIGPSYVERQSTANESGYAYRFDVKQKTIRYRLNLSTYGGLDELHFNGESDGLSRYWAVSGGGEMNLSQHLAISLSGSYRKDTYLQKIPQTKDDLVEADTNCQYRLNRWLTLSGRYTYRKLESDDITNEFEDHRFVLGLTATSRTYRW